MTRDFRSNVLFSGYFLEVRRRFLHLRDRVRSRLSHPRHLSGQRRSKSVVQSNPFTALKSMAYSQIRLLSAGNYSTRIKLLECTELHFTELVLRGWFRLRQNGGHDDRRIRIRFFILRRGETTFIRVNVDCAF